MPLVAADPLGTVLTRTVVDAFRVAVRQALKRRSATHLVGLIESSSSPSDVAETISRVLGLCPVDGRLFARDFRVASPDTRFWLLVTTAFVLFAPKPAATAADQPSEEPNQDWERALEARATSAKAREALDKASELADRLGIPPGASPTREAICGLAALLVIQGAPARLQKLVIQTFARRYTRRPPYRLSHGRTSPCPTC